MSGDATPLDAAPAVVRAGGGPLVWTLIAAGAVTTFVGLGYDQLAPRAVPGFGLRQGLLVAAGLALVGTGRVVAGPTAWQDRLRALSRASLAEALGFVLIAAQVALVVLVAARFHLESPAFYDRILPLTFAAFVVNHVLPPTWRLPWFVAVSWVGVYLVFGVGDGAWLVALGLGLIALCHLPVAFGGRVALLLATGVGLGLLRAGLAGTPWSSAIWPILGSMFMFRLIIYMYDLRHAKTPARLSQTLAYFFLLPNLVFPLFPVVDWATFCRTCYDRPAVEIYQRGVRWMLVGVTHLIAYRFVYQFLTIGPAEVASGGDLLRYMVTTFLLYLKVSGQFHLVAGMLHLFGFRLPETHRFFFLAAGFTDFWRRINIYWKEFMTKVFYFPAYFRLRKRGETIALVLATLLVFVSTWALHSYQWFWLLGSVLVTWPDTLFWLALALILVVNVLIEARRGRTRSLGVRHRTVRQSTFLALRILGTFTTMCILWSFWSSPTVGEWMALLGRADLGGADLVRAAMGALGLGLLLVAGDQLRSRILAPASPRTNTDRAAFTPVYAFHAGWLLLLLGIGSPRIAERAPGRTQTALQDLRLDKLNARDAVTQFRGYYENLTGVNQYNPRLWATFAQQPRDWQFLRLTGVMENTRNFQHLRFRPNYSMMLNGTVFGTNRWGMRDRDYTRARPPRTLRVALLGQSYVVGQNVNAHEVFESLVEKRLNSEQPFADRGFERYEILNMALPAIDPVRQLLLLRDQLPGFEPQTVLLVGHPNDADALVIHLTRMFLEGIAMPFAELDSAIARAGLHDQMTHDEAIEALLPEGAGLLAWVYGEFVPVARAQGMHPVWVYIPTPGPRTFRIAIPDFQDVARGAGFAVLNLEDVYGTREARELQVRPWDTHPNPLAHQLIAERLYQSATVLLPDSGTSTPVP